MSLLKSKYLSQFLSFLFLFSSCSQKVKDNSNEIIADVNGEKIYSYDLETTIQQEIFDELNRIYTMKSIALDQMIDIQLIKSEANKRGKSYDEFMDSYFKEKINPLTIDSLSRIYRLNEPIPKIRENELTYNSNESYEGKISNKYVLESCVKKNLIDSLRKKSIINKYLYPPKSPNINIDNELVYYRGNLNSKVTMIIVSDFECDKCIQFHNIYQNIYLKYKEKVRFGYINFSAIPTLSAIACNAANNQGKFWEFHDSLYAHKGFIDSLTVYNIAKKLNLDINDFKRNIESEKNANKINATIQKLVSLGLFATPTVIINNRLIYNSFSSQEFEYLLEKELGS